MHPTAPSLSWVPVSISLQQVVPSHFHNAWDIVAFALVASTLLKGICDYGGTYLVNYAGFGMITDLRNNLYDAVLRRSVAFFQKHATGTHRFDYDQRYRASAVRNVDGAGDFLQQLFTLIFTAGVVMTWGASWPGCCFSLCSSSPRGASDGA